MKKSLLIISMVLMLTGCITPSFIYDGIPDKLPTQFVENTIEPIGYYDIKSNAKKFESDAKDNLIIYGAQVAWEHGYRYFVLDDIETRHDYNDYIGSYYQAKGVLTLFNDPNIEQVAKYEKFWDAQKLFNAQSAIDFNTDVDRQREKAEFDFWW